MAVFTCAINDSPPAFEKKSSEVAFIVQVLDLIEAELVRVQGTRTMGAIVRDN